MRIQRVAIGLFLFAFAGCAGKSSTVSTLGSPGATSIGTATASPGTETTVPPPTSSTPEITKGPDVTPEPVTPKPTSAYTTSSGVTGKVLAGPTCPVERADSPCPDRPVSGAKVTASNSSASAHTDSNGHFTLKLPPGHYTLHAEAQGMMGGCSDESVTVTSHHYTDVTITCDTGIR